MSDTNQQTRRQLLKLTGSAAAVGLAGCTSLGVQSGGSDEESGDDHDEEETDSHDGESGDNHDGDSDHDEEETDSHDGDGDHHEEETDTHDGDGDHHEEETDSHDGDSDHHEEETDTHDGDGHGHNHDEGTPEEPSASAEVTMKTESGEYHFGPHLVWVEPGGTVTWTLESGSHDVVAYHPDNDKPLRMPDAADAWSSDLLTETGNTFEHTFETEGVYDYYCTPHESLGMVGTVIVGQPDAHGQPALETPQKSLPDGARSELSDLADTVNEALGHDH